MWIGPSTPQMTGGWRLENQRDVRTRQTKKKCTREHEQGITQNNTAGEEHQPPPETATSDNIKTRAIGCHQIMAGSKYGWWPLMAKQEPAWSCSDRDSCSESIRIIRLPSSCPLSLRPSSSRNAEGAQAAAPPSSFRLRPPRRFVCISPPSALSGAA